MSLVKHAAGLAMFSGMTDEEIEQVVQCTGAVVCKFDAGEYVSKPGSRYKRIGIMLSGKARAEWIDPDGNKFILDTIEKGGIFGLSAAISEKHSENAPETYVSAEEACEILMMDASRLLNECERHCDAHRKLVYNAMFSLAKRNAALVWKSCHMSQRSMRKKLMSYLAVNEREREKPFVIPMNRQELADYLGVDRSAMSAELSRMKKDGLIEYWKNEFTIIKLS